MSHLGQRRIVSGTASADGRLLSFPSWETGDVSIRDVISGESRLVTKKDGKEIGVEVEFSPIIGFA